MNINFYRKNVYGVQNIYIADPDIAIGIRRLTGKKTVDTSDMGILSDLFKVEFTEVIAPAI